MEPELEAILRRPFAEQVAAFRLRLGKLKGTQRWDDLAGAEHDRAFMVAGAAKADLLADLAGAVDRAISEGTGLEAFRRDFREIVERQGWHGWTGEETERGRAWRTRVIYRTNMASTYAAARSAQLVAAGFPLWVYRHGGSADPRPQHLAWDGLTLPADHPFWTTHGPPNGWGCSCYILGARSAAGARRLGGDPDKALPEGWDARDPRTGAPKGIDRGWDHAAGATVDRDVAAMADKTIRWERVLAKEFMSSVPEETRDRLARATRASPVVRTELRRYVERVLGERNGAPIAPEVLRQQYKTAGLLTEAQVRMLGRLLGAPVAGYDFALARDDVVHIARRHGEALGGLPGVTPQIVADALAGLDVATFSQGREPGTVAAEIDLGGWRWRMVLRRQSARRMLRLVTLFPVGRAP
jgi:hypothetical protein